MLFFSVLETTIVIATRYSSSNNNLNLKSIILYGGLCVFYIFFCISVLFLLAKKVNLCLDLNNCALHTFEMKTFTLTSDDDQLHRLRASDDDTNYYFIFFVEV